jgi:hypothetical protein
MLTLTGVVRLPAGTALTLGDIDHGAWQPL